MPNYAKTIIYKLVNYDYPELVYVGSTTNFTKRKQNHKQICYNEKSKKHNLKVYEMIRENGGWENWNMIKICDYPCENKREAELEEDRYMTELKSNMNSNRASRTHKQYYEDNKEKIQEYKKDYYEDNKEKIQDKMKEYRESNKEKIQDKMKEYYESNKEKIQEYKKDYYETHKDMIRERINAKITCKCGSVVTKIHLKRHERTKKHTDLINPIQ
jgi:hypothetical protein